MEGGYEKKIQIILLVVFIMILNGCAINPKAKYSTAPSENDIGNPSFYLNGSIVNITIPPDQQNKEDSTTTKLGFENPVKIDKVEQLKKAKATVTKTEDKTKLYYIDAYETFYYKPNFSITYHDNTKLIKSIGTDAKDTRKDAIVAVGGIISKAIPLISIFTATPIEVVEKEKLALPLSLDITKVNLTQNLSWTKIPDYQTWWFRIRPEGQANKTIDKQEYFKNAKSNYVRSFPYSTCQQIVFEITKSEETPEEIVQESSKIAYKLKVANPRIIQGINYPPKGTITMHTICGADIKREQDESSSALDLLSEVFTQAEAIKKAYDDNKKSDDETSDKEE